MSAQEQKIEEIKQTIVSNRVVQIIIAIGTTVAATCTAAILLFIWDANADIKVLKSGQEQVQKKVDDIRGSMDALSDRFTLLSTEQVRQGEQLNNIKEKIH